MNSLFVDILKKLINEQGREALVNPSNLKALLSDYTKGEYKKESRLLLMAHEAGIIKAIDSTKEIETCKKQLVRVLNEENDLVMEKAVDLVDALTLVLMKNQENEASQSAVCENCKKELQKDWGVCPYCGTPAVKIMRSLPEAETVKTEPPETQQEPLKAKTPETEPPTAPLQEAASAPQAPPAAKIKKTKRSLIIAGAILLFILITGVVITVGITSKNTRQQKAREIFDKGIVYLQQGYEDTAIRYFKHALSLDPGNGQVTDALQQAKNQQSAREFFNSGKTFLGNNNYDNAIAPLNEAIRLYPDFTAAYNKRGYAYMMKNQYEMAIRDFNDAIWLDPNAYAYAWRGLAYYQTGQKNKAIQDLETAVSLDPNHVWAKQSLRHIRGY
jgi:tetratricopeptide (TPR) repeat protein